MRGPVEGGVVPRHDAGVAARQAAVDLTLKWSYISLLYPAYWMKIFLYSSLNIFNNTDTKSI